MTHPAIAGGRRSTNLSDRVWTAAEDSRATANLGPAGQPVLDKLDGWDGPVRFFRLVTTRYLRFRRGDEREF